MTLTSREGPYKTRLKKRIEREFPGSVVVKLDTADTQGLPDMLILFGDRWAALEVKRSSTAEIQPNQVYWVERMDQMSYAAFVYPENEDEVIDALQHALRA